MFASLQERAVIYSERDCGYGAGFCHQETEGGSSGTADSPV